MGLPGGQYIAELNEIGQPVPTLLIVAKRFISTGDPIHRDDLTKNDNMQLFSDLHL